MKLAIVFCYTAWGRPEICSRICGGEWSHDCCGTSFIICRPFPALKHLRQPSSSLPSLQSSMPSHLYVSCMHCLRSAHLNCVGEQVIGGQPSSSWLSKQSLSPSHTHVCGIQWPDRGQVNCKTKRNERRSRAVRSPAPSVFPANVLATPVCSPGNTRTSSPRRNRPRPNRRRSRSPSRISTWTARTGRCRTGTGWTSTSRSCSPSRRCSRRSRSRRRI